jgi:hypothetical protein
MLYIAFVCSPIWLGVVSALAIRDLREGSKNKVGVIFALLDATFPFIYIANEVFKHLF